MYAVIVFRGGSSAAGVNLFVPRFGSPITVAEVNLQSRWFSNERNLLVNLFSVCSAAALWLCGRSSALELVLFTLASGKCLAGEEKPFWRRQMRKVWWRGEERKKLKM